MASDDLKTKTDPFESWLAGVFFGGIAVCIGIDRYYIEPDTVFLVILATTYLLELAYLVGKIIWGIFNA